MISLGRMVGASSYSPASKRTSTPSVRARSRNAIALRRPSLKPGQQRKIVGLIGYPLKHSISPRFQSKAGFCRVLIVGW